ncbi:type II/IV secretion system protein, partial [Candidatus Sumerlaeota bacterium]|nr:type II/IV secretion system protein [Candidatus Sumerlaeota bacterium]
VHLEPGRGNMTIRFRIDVVLTKMLNIPANLIGPVTSRIKVLANMDVTERRRPQDGHITLHQGGRNFDFRIATLPTANGEKVAVRILDSARVMVGMGDVGMNAAQLKAAERLIHQPYGVILVTGPTGSGKTSTLYAALNELNDEKRHLVTIEDPIEYQLDGINQVEVDPNIGLTFSEGLRAILRQDPNIIMVGEIRDADTAKTAIRAALTGHLVFSTLHTNSAIGAFQALANLGATPYMIGSAVTGVIAQRLVRKLCPACRKAAAPTKAIAAQLGVKSASREKWHRAVGCPACLGTGYSGRTGIFELIEMTEKLRQGVLNDESPAKLRQIAAAEGRLSIREAGLEKVRQGITSPEEVIQKVILEG